jgi:hypothetical protein
MDTDNLLRIRWQYANWGRSARTSNMTPGTVFAAEHRSDSRGSPKGLTGLDERLPPSEQCEFRLFDLFRRSSAASCRASGGSRALTEARKMEDNRAAIQVAGYVDEFPRP